MSPLTAELKCSHYEKGQYRHEPEGEAEIPHLLKMVVESKTTVKQASSVKGVSYRQSRKTIEAETGNRRSQRISAWQSRQALTEGTKR